MKIKSNNREAVANSETLRDIPLGDVMPGRESVQNAEQGVLDGDKWFKVSPFGAFRGSQPGRIQHFGEAESDAMVAEFNSLKGKLKKLFRGVPIYIGHPDVDPVAYPDSRRLGKLVDVQTRADGLWAKPDWNSLGAENVDEGYWVFPSPFWDAPAGQAEFRPDRLISIGLTNTPRITESEPVANVKPAASSLVNGQESLVQHGVIYGREKTNNSTNKQNTKMDRTKLIKELGLEADATDEEIMAKIGSLKEAADAKSESERKEKEDADKAESEKAKKAAEKEKQENSKIIQLTKEREDAENALQTQRTATANSLLDVALLEGRITKSERGDFEKQFADDYEKAANSLAGKKKTGLNQESLNLEKSRQKVSDERGRRETIANAVQKVQSESGADYNTAYKRVQAMPEMKPLFEAMVEPSGSVNGQ